MSEEQDSQKQEFKTLVDDSPDIIARFDRDLRYVYVNRIVEKVMGIPPASFIGKTNKDLHISEAQETYWSKNIATVFETGKETVIELNFDSPSLGKRYFQTRIVPEFFPDGSIPYVLTVAYDITELKDYEDVLKKRTEELEEARARDAAILENIGDGLIVTDGEGKITIINHAAQTMLKTTTKDVIGQLLVEVVPAEDEKERAIPLQDRPTSMALQSGKRTSAIHYYKKSDGTKFPAAVVVTPLIVSGKVVGSIDVFRDITREKVIDEMKTELISLSSHELRTPLSAMRGYLSMIRDGDYGPTNPGLKKPLDMIETSTKRLIHIVNEMLDVSRIESGKLVLRLSEQNIQDLVKEAIATLQPLADKKNIQLIVEQSTQQPVQADKEKVIEILNNLIGNSLKFTEKGSIAISLAQKNDMVIVSVTDTGIGIAKEDHPKLFSKFDELKLKQAGKTSGTGLGLYISHELVKKMGGDMWIEKSAPGEGSTFAFSLPHINSKSAQTIKNALDRELNIAEK